MPQDSILEPLLFIVYIYNRNFIMIIFITDDTVCNHSSISVNGYFIIIYESHVIHSNKCDYNPLQLLGIFVNQSLKW